MKVCYACILLECIIKCFIINILKYELTFVIINICIFYLRLPLNFFVGVRHKYLGDYEFFP